MCFACCGFCLRECGELLGEESDMRPVNALMGTRPPSADVSRMAVGIRID